MEIQSLWTIVVILLALWLLGLKTTTCPMAYMERDEVKALLAAPELSHPLGLRDLTLLTFLYNTGARVSEAVGLDVPDVRFEKPRWIITSWNFCHFPYR